MKDQTNRSFWNRISGLYDQFIKKDQHAYIEIYRFLRARLSPNMTVLELATGTGLIALAIADKVKSIEATDFSPQMIAEAKKKTVPYNVRFSVQDACHLPYANSSFDCVIISNALHIMPNPALVLKNISRVLKDDGVLIAPTFTHANNNKIQQVKAALMGVFGFKTYHKWTEQGYCEFIRQNGYNIEQKRVLKSVFPLTYIEAHKQQKHVR